MKIKSIKKVGKLPVYDISVSHAEHYVLENDVVTHNTGIMYSCNTAFIIGRAQEKEGKDLVGYNFNINVEKSRFVREKSKIPLTVTFEGGVNKYSGMLDMALDSGLIQKPAMGWYQLVDTETGELVGNKFRAKEANCDEYLGKVMENPKFTEYVEGKYKL